MLTDVVSGRAKVVCDVDYRKASASCRHEFPCDNKGESINGSLSKTSTKMVQCDTQSPEGPKAGPDPAPPSRAPWGPQYSGSVHFWDPSEQDIAISTALQPEELYIHVRAHRPIRQS